MSAPKRRAAFSALAGVSRPADFGVGKWSRIATYGTKRQRQADGSVRVFEFDDSAFLQGLRNFRATFAGRGRGMGSDFEHQTINAPLNGKPAPNLCFWTALGVIDQTGRLLGLEDLQGDAAPLDPAAERSRLAAQNPAEDPNPAGTWAYCGEITPLGESLIPNYSQLSPLFSDDDEDEAGNPIGFAWQNVSFVNVAFQGGTAFTFRKGTPMNDQMPPELSTKLAKFGYMADKPESIHDAVMGYMASDEPAAERAKVAEMYKMMAKMGAMGCDPQSDGPGMLPKGAPSATPPELAAPGQMGGMMPEKDMDKDGMARMNKILEGQVAALTKRVLHAEALAQQTHQAQEARAKVEYQTKLTAFRKEMLESESARYLPDQVADLDALIADVGGDLDKARKHAEKMPPVAAFRRWTQGGNPIGITSVPPPGISSMGRNAKGFAFNKAVRDLLAKEKGLSFELAQQRIAAEQPDLYEVTY